LYRVRNRGTVSYIYIWISNFPSTTCKEAVFVPVHIFGLKNQIIHEDQWDRTEDPDMNPQNYTHYRRWGRGQGGEMTQTIMYM
jgi:hypothetical protein